MFTSPFPVLIESERFDQNGKGSGGWATLVSCDVPSFHNIVGPVPRGLTGFVS
jgi:hypothetical protein